MTPRFWKRQGFRLGFGLLCALPLLLRATGIGNIPDGAAGNRLDIHNWILFLPQTLIFILFMLPLLRCGIFFRLWNRYAYFRRACTLMLVLRVLESILACTTRDTWALDGLIMLATFPFMKLMELSGHPLASISDYLMVFTWGMDTYIVLWMVIGLLFYLQVFTQFIRTRRWEYK